MAFKSHLIRQLTGVIGSCISTELSSNVHPTILKKVTEFFKPYEDNIIAGGYLNAAQLTEAADHMEIADLLDLACQIFDPLIKQKSPEEIQKLIRITCLHDDEENEPKKSDSVGLPDMDDDILKGIQQLTTDGESHPCTLHQGGSEGAFHIVSFPPRRRHEEKSCKLPYISSMLFL